MIPQTPCSIDAAPTSSAAAAGTGPLRVELTTPNGLVEDAESWGWNLMGRSVKEEIRQHAGLKPPIIAAVGKKHTRISITGRGKE